MIDISAPVAFDDMINDLSERKNIIAHDSSVIRIEYADIDNRKCSLGEYLFQVLLNRLTEICAYLDYAVKIIKVGDIKADRITLIVLGVSLKVLVAV